MLFLKLQHIYIMSSMKKLILNFKKIKIINLINYLAHSEKNTKVSAYRGGGFGVNPNSELDIRC